MKSLIKNLLIILLSLSGLAILAMVAFWALEGEMASRLILLVFLTLMLFDAIGYFVAAWGVCRNIRKLYPWTLALLTINIIALIFDQIGVIDLTVGGINLLLLILVIYNHKTTSKISGHN